MLATSRQDTTIMLLNCRGVLRRDPEAALQAVHGAQIAIFTETWLGEDDSPHVLPGYRAFHFPRLTRQGAPRGGVAIYVAQSLARHASVWPEERYEGGQISWLRIGAEAGMQQDLFLAGCYFEPSLTSDDEAWEAFEEQAAMAAGLGWVLAAGDFNARTGLSPGRRSADATVNAAGRRLLRIAQAVELTIANGRVPGPTSAHHTYCGENGRSVVDYFLLGPDLVHTVAELQVLLPPAPSMDHRMLRLRLRIPPGGLDAQPLADACPMLPPGRRLRFTAEHVEAYNHRVRQQEAAEKLARVAAAAEAAGEVEQLAQVYAALESTLSACMQQAGGTEVVAAARTRDARAVRRRQLRSHPRMQELTRRWRQARRHHDIEAMRQLDREISSVRRALERQQQAERQRTLLDMLRDEPARFWSYFRAEDGKGAPHSAAALRQYCMTLFTMAAGATADDGAAGPGSGQVEQPVHLQGDGEVLNSPFTAEEVEAGIAALKRHKAVVGILNADLLRGVSNEVAPAIAAIFNAVVRLGRMPADMALGVITMVKRTMSKMSAK